MKTHISKIARLPHTIREQLNRRLHNGEVGRTILQWLNDQPETKQILADLFAGKPVTHQNLSEWRRGGYQEWLLHQQRLEWFDQLTEQEIDLEKHDDCRETYETFSRLLLFEIGQNFAALQKIKNPHDRWERLQNITREFARLQNAYNWSRHIGLKWDQYKDQLPPDSDEPESEPGAKILASGEEEEAEFEDQSNNHPDEEQTAEDESDGHPSPDSSLVTHHALLPCHSSPPRPSSPPPPRLVSSQARADGSLSEGASTPNTNSPQLSEASPPLDIGPRTLDKDIFQPIPAYSATTPTHVRPAAKKPAYKTPRPPIRGRRFVCVEG